MLATLHCPKRQTGTLPPATQPASALNIARRPVATGGPPASKVDFTALCCAQLSSPHQRRCYPAWAAARTAGGARARTHSGPPPAADLTSEHDWALASRSSELRAPGFCVASGDVEVMPIVARGSRVGAAVGSQRGHQGDIATEGLAAARGPTIAGTVVWASHCWGTTPKFDPGSKNPIAAAICKNVMSVCVQRINHRAYPR